MKQSRESYIHELIEDGTGIDCHCIGDAFILQLWIDPEPTTATTSQIENWAAMLDYMSILAESNHDVSYDRRDINPRINALAHVEVMDHLAALAGRANVQGHHLTDYEMIESRIEAGDVFVIQTNRATHLYHMTYLPTSNDPFYGHCLSQIKRYGYINTILKTIEQGVCDVNIITIKWSGPEGKTSPQGKTSVIRSLFHRLKARFT